MFHNIVQEQVLQDSADGIDDFNIKIPMEFKIYSDENSDALPATCKITLVYNKRAAKQSIGYSGFSDFSNWRPTRTLLESI